jgi:TPR repeat protein
MMFGGPKLAVPSAAYLEKACSRGHGDSCGNLAVLESKGLGGRPANPQRAVTLATSACEKNSAFACGVLGAMQMNGAGTPKDEASAAKLFEISCNGGEATGCTYLAVCHYQGSGVPQDVHKAADFFRKACDGGNGQACRLLAEMSTVPQAAAPTASPTMF